MQGISEAESNEAIGERLELTRLAMGFGSQAAWCRAVGIAPNTWNNYKQGRYRIGLDEAKRVVKETGVDLDWIYYGKKEMLPAHLAEKIKRLLDGHQTGNA